MCSQVQQLQMSFNKLKEGCAKSAYVAAKQSQTSSRRAESTALSNIGVEVARKPCCALTRDFHWLL